MPDEGTERNWRTPTLVAVFGGIGGLTAWVWSITIGTPLGLGTAGAVAVNLFLGIVAGFVGIYAIKVEPARLLMHTLALALLCGFAWKPMLEAGRELVVTRMQDSEVATQVESARLSIDALQQASPDNAGVYIEELEVISQELMRSGDVVRNPKLKREVDRAIADSVGALTKAARIAPEAGARALGSIGAAASSDNRPAVSRAASVALVELAEEQNFDVGISSEVSNSLMRLSAAARAERRDEEAGALREQGIEVFRKATERARRDRPERIRELRERSIVSRDTPPPG